MIPRVFRCTVYYLRCPAPPCKLRITAPQAATTAILVASWLCVMLVVVDFITMYLDNGKVAFCHTIPQPLSIHSGIEKINLQNYYKKLHTFIRQYTLLFSIIFPVTHLCSYKSKMEIAGLCIAWRKKIFFVKKRHNV